MADPIKDPAPQFDAKAFEAMIQSAVKTGIDGVVKESQATQARAAEEKAAADALAAEKAKRTADPFHTMIEPALEPALKAAQAAELRANMAADAVGFYTDPANAVTLKYRGKIEEVINAQIKRGNPISRQDAWNWLRGGELYGELGTEAIKAHEAKLEEARKATAAAAGVTAGTVQFKKDPTQMETQELGEALKGVTF